MARGQKARSCLSLKRDRKGKPCAPYVPVPCPEPSGSVSATVRSAGCRLELVKGRPHVIRSQEKPQETPQMRRIKRTFRSEVTDES
jgi:hypothetical protein